MARLVEGFKKGAAATGVSFWTFRRWSQTEGMPTIVIGGRFIFDLDSIDIWLKSKEGSGTVPAPQTEPIETGKIRQIRA